MMILSQERILYQVNTFLKIAVSLMFKDTQNCQIAPVKMKISHSLFISTHTKYIYLKSKSSFLPW